MRMFSGAKAARRQPKSLAASFFASVVAMAAMMQPLTFASVLPEAAIKVMVVGNSITHGHNGDYTWRYRLWQWFKNESIPVSFVGPYTGTHPQAKGTPPAPPLLQDEIPSDLGPLTDGGYAIDAEPFDSRHFAIWGCQLKETTNRIAKAVSTYKPDYLLVELGFNDLGWFVTGPHDTLANMKAFVDHARSAKPGLKFAIANVPYRQYMPGRDDLPTATDQYNGLLVEAIREWDTKASPVKLVQFRENYSCELDACPAGHDGLHPNELGDYQIASAFSQTLHRAYHLGSAPLTVPAPKDISRRACPVPRNMTARAVPSGIVVTWDHVYNAYGYNIRSRTAGAAEFNGDGSSQSSNRFDTMWTSDGDKWEYQVRADCGSGIFSDWTDAVSAVAHPQTAPGPKNIVTRPKGDGLGITWEPPDGDFAIDRYGVHMFDLDAPGSFPMVVGFKEPSATIRRLTVGHRYGIAIATWTDAGGGIPAGASPVRVGYATPPAPTGLQVFTRDATTVKLVWVGSSAAAGYRVWSRNINDNRDDFKSNPHTADKECQEIGFLSPGAWNFMFCVTALNGDLESEKSNCVIASRTIDEVSDCPGASELRGGNGADDEGIRSSNFGGDGLHSQAPLVL